MNLHSLQSSPEAFRDALRIDADGESIPIGDLIEPWQDNDFKALDPAWLAVTGQGDSPQKSRAWLERPRGHSKTSDLAIMCAWALFASRRKITGYGAAGDKDQARLLRDAVERLVRLNPWLQSILTVNNWSVINEHTGSTLEILSSDAPTSYGLLPDFIVADEVTHWQKPDLWESLISSAAKRKNCVVVVITNAGFGETWQHETREAVRNDPKWLFSRIEGPVAKWITEDRLAEQRRLLPDIAYRRLWLNQWTTGSGDALSDGEIQRALTQTGPLSRPEKGWQYVAGLDLGLSRDKAALAVVGRHVGYWREKRKRRKKLPDTQQALIDCGIMDPPDDDAEDVFEEGSNRYKLVRLEVWNPADSATGKVDIEEIETTIAALDRTFNLHVGCDPWQAAYLIERLQKRGVPIEPVDFIGANLKSMCSAVLESFSESAIDLYNDPRLIQDLHNLRVEERSYGVRLISPRGTSGHGDSATALAIALNLARNRGGFTNRPVSGKLIAY